MAKRSSRTLKMMGEFMALHNAGHSIPEIAKMTRVDFATIYRHLDEIAEQNGVTRESLLETPHPNYSRKGGSKMAVYRLKGKTMHELVKHGFTKADFCAKYQCTEDELLSQIRKIHCNDTRAVNEFLNELTFNEKRAGKGKKDSKMSAEPATSQAAPASDVPAENAQPTAMPLTITEQREKRLAELNAKKQELLEEAKEAGRRYVEADKGYGKYYGKLLELDRKIAQLKEELKDYETQREDARKEFSKFLSDRTKAREERDACTLKITKISMDISELLAVQLIVCDDGTIEALDSPDFVMDEEGSDKYYGLLVHDRECSEFRMKDLKLLSRAMAIRNNSKDRRVVATFDNDTLTQYFAIV